MLAEIDVRVPVSPERLWPALVDHAAMAAWSGALRAELRRPGAGDPNGVGARRAITLLPGFVVEEEVVLFEPPHRLDYRITAGMPGLAHHAGSVRLYPDGDGCRIEWRIQITWKPKHPMRVFGPPLVRTIGLALRLGLRRLGRRLAPTP